MEKSTKLAWAYLGLHLLRYGAPALGAALILHSLLTDGHDGELAVGIVLVAVSVFGLFWLLGKACRWILGRAQKAYKDEQPKGEGMGNVIDRPRALIDHPDE